MIRINLIPRTQRKVRVGQRQLAIFLLLLVVEIGAMVFIYYNKQAEVDRMKNAKTALKGEIATLKKEVGDFDKLKRQRNQLIAQADAIKKLQYARTGPLWMMRELTHVLTASKGPTVNEAAYKEMLLKNPNAGYNSQWNPRRVWLTAIKESNSRLHIQGKAKDHDDVAELLKRLNLSRVFKGVRLQRNSLVKDKKLGLKVIKFSLACKVNH
jgi:type IV pilus assembly protein PilN